MHIPDSLAPLFETGVIEQVVRPLMSGKEALVYLVVSHGELCVAKAYKDAQMRSFKHRAEYTEGRKTRNTRDQRAMARRTAHGRAQDEAAWKSTEVDMIRRLHAGGVRVPEPKAFLDGVLVMECVADAEGNPAPRLGELSFSPEDAQRIFDGVIREAVRMLSLGIVHGDLSPFNVLAGANGPVIIDFPQAMDAAGNNNARRVLLRDIDNFHTFLRTYAPRAPRLPYAEEMWDLFESAALTAETRLTGRYTRRERPVSNESVLGLVRSAEYDASRRQQFNRGSTPGGHGASRGRPGGPRPQPQGPPPVYVSKAGGRLASGSVMKLTPREPPPTPEGAPRVVDRRTENAQAQPRHDPRPRDPQPNDRRDDRARGPQQGPPQRPQGGAGGAQRHPQDQRQRPSHGRPDHGPTREQRPRPPRPHEQPTQQPQAQERGHREQRPQRPEPVVVEVIRKRR